LMLKRILERISIEWDKLIKIAYFSDEWREILDMVVNIWVPYKVGNFLNSLATMDSDGRDLFHKCT
jgi:hypothetical protein